MNHWLCLHLPFYKLAIASDNSLPVFLIKSLKHLTIFLTFRCKGIQYGLLSIF
uniref:Uncharacterized protein n=1 Tax=Rhizophora mucronata TaxID=61149 RepID=A0A2P2J7I0_RHIMU